MESLRKYNQVVFAIIGSITIVLLLLAGWRFLKEEFFNSSKPRNPTLIAKDKLDSLKALNLRNQIISLERVKRFDTTSNTYLIPVYHKELQESVFRDSKIMGLLDTEYADYANDFMSYGYGSYNNLLLHNFTTRKTHIVCKTRVNINQYSVFNTSKNVKLIVFSGWDEDTNADGKLNNKDFKQAYIYDHSTGLTKKIVNSTYNILDYEYLKRVDKLIFKVTEVTSELGEDERPDFFVFYSPNTQELSPVIEPEVINILQDIIDG